jgi:putative hydrolase of the HAD superfamily
VADPFAVTFDLWQTLIVDQPGGAETRRRWRLQGAFDALNKAGFLATWEQVHKAYNGCLDACQEIRGRGEDVSFSGQVHIFLDEIQTGLADGLSKETFAEITETYREAYFSSPLLAAPGSHEVLDDLRQRGIRVGLISNTGTTPGVTFRQSLQGLGLHDYFDVLTFSDEVGLAKPSPRIFHLTLEQLGVTPGRAVHIGDTLEHDVAGARAAGMGSVWINHGNDRSPHPAPDAIVGCLEQVLPELNRLLGRLAD